MTQPLRCPFSIEVDVGGQPGAAAVCARVAAVNERQASAALS